MKKKIKKNLIILKKCIGRCLNFVTGFRKLLNFLENTTKVSKLGTCDFPLDNSSLNMKSKQKNGTIWKISRNLTLWISVILEEFWCHLFFWYKLLKNSNSNIYVHNNNELSPLEENSKTRLESIPVKTVRQNVVFWWIWRHQKVLLKLTDL